MTEFRHIIVPLDGSDFSRAAIPHALALAEADRTTIELISAIDTASILSGAGYSGNLAAGAPAYGSGTEVLTVAPHLIDSARESREEEIEATAEEVRASTKARVLWSVVEGRPSDAVAARAQSSGADLVVMSTHGRGGLERAWLGSVADRLVRRLTTPLLLVRPEVDRSRELEFKTAASVERVLVTLDGSKLAEAALAPAAAIARRLRSSLVLLQVADTEARLDSPYLTPTDEESQKHSDDLQDHARHYLESVAERLRADGVEIADVQVREGSVIATILELAHSQADLVVMATHGRGGLKRWVLGSVSDKVLRGADLPVLLVRAEGDGDSG